MKPGYLFGAFVGRTLDGRNYIADAVNNGARVIVAPTGTVLPDKMQHVQLILDDNPRRIFADIAAEFYGAQPDNVAAVTGTNGKTSVVHFVRQLWKGRRYKNSGIGTLTGSMTTPHAAALQAKISDLAAAGVTHLVMEASSHGLDQYRLDGAKIGAAGFTNLSHDHLDYHGGMDDYFASKKRLFTEVLQDGGVAVLNADDGRFDELVSAIKARDAGITIWSYGREGEAFKITGSKPMPHGKNLDLEIFGKSVSLHLPLVGGFQAMNALCALGLVMALAGDESVQDSDLSVLENLSGAPGRLQLVKGDVEDAKAAGAVYVDYAHTPDALSHVLRALRPHTAGRLVCVFGCGGNRDTEKRAVMGRIAGELADRVIVTDDNPRSEDPALIRQDILLACPAAEEIADRRMAICHGVAGLDTGDVLVIAGKGHEQGQVFAEETLPFDDVQEAKNAIEERA